METDFINEIDIDPATGQEKKAADIAADPVFNTRLCDHITGAREGKLDKVAGAGELYIKRRLRERSVVRRVNDFKPTSDADLVRLPDEELPLMWGEVQNDTKGAMSIGFADAVENETFWRRTFKVRFFVITSPEYYKNEWELKAHAHDTVKQFTEDILLDLDEEEDRHWFGASDDCVGPIAAATDAYAANPQQVGLSGEIQNFHLGAFSRDTSVDAKYLFSDRQLPLGTWVVNQRFAAHYEKLRADDVGARAGELYFDGADKALGSGKIGDVPILFTSKNHIVPDDTVYQYTTPDYLGVCREFQKPTMSMRKERRTIFFDVEEIIAMSIANVGGVLRGVFSNHPA